MYVCTYKRSIWLSIGENGIDRDTRKLWWHISNLSFCKGISPTHERCSGVNPINPSAEGKAKEAVASKKHRDFAVH